MTEPAPTMAELEGTGELSHNQARLWFIDSVSPQQSLYNVHLRFRILGDIRIDLLKRALSKIVERHAVLRTSYHEEGGDVVQRVHPPQPIPLAVRPSSQSDDDAAVEDWIRSRASLPFELSRAPMLRALLASDREGVHHLVVTIHHIATDAWSLGIVDNELWTTYEALAAGQPSPLPDLEGQYHEYAAHQRQCSHDGSFDRDRAYWREKLAGAPYVELPSDVPSQALSESPGDDIDHRLPLALVNRLEELARAHRCSLFVVMQAALDALLHRYTSASDVVTGTATAGRTRASLAPLIGFFANMLVFRVPITGEMTFDEVVDVVRATVLDALEHQDLPFDEIVEDLNPPRVLGQNPLFQVAFQLLYTDEMTRRLNNIVVEQESSFGSGSTWFDIVFTVDRGPTSCNLNISYNRERFDRHRMSHLLDAYVHVLEHVAADPSVRICSLELAVGSQQHRTSVHSELPPFRDITTRIREHSDRAPQAVAVSYGERMMTYAELVWRAEAVAAALAERSVGRGSRVGLFLEPSDWLVPAMLGALMSGAAYVPLPSDHPIARLAGIASAADLAIILAMEASELATGLGIDVVELSAVQEAARASTLPDLRPRDIAYVLFTSGSTGKPKGVCVTHDNLSSFVDQCTTTFGIGADTRILQLASFAFDASVLETLATLGAGGRICMSSARDRQAPELLVRFCSSELVNTAHFTPALLSLINPSDLPSLRVMLIGGEAFGFELVNTWSRPGLCIFNAYGPTETTVASLAYECVEASYNAPLPIGTAMLGEYAVVVDSYGQPAPVGVPGELAISGCGLSVGYLHDPALTASRFVASPFGSPGERMYLTGDACVLRNDGTIRFLGRLDDQIKLRGHRISLMEVEQAVAALENVEQASVVLSEGATSVDKRLVAYVRQDGKRGDHIELRRALSNLLPNYMLPASFVDIDAFPTTPSGKVDRRALAQVLPPMSDGSTGTSSDVRAIPAATTAGQVAQLFAERLRLTSVPEDVSFFDLGGNSLQLASLGYELRRVFGVQIVTQDLLVHQSVTQIAGLLAARSAPSVYSADIESVGTDHWRVLSSSADAMPVVIVHDGSGGLFSYSDLQREIGRSSAVFGLDAPDLGDDQPTVEALAAAHLAAVHRHLADRPYVVLGWSFGGLVAHAMYRLGHVTDTNCQLLVMVDTLHPADRRADVSPDRVFFEHLRGNGVLPEAARWVGIADSPEERVIASVEASGVNPRDWPTSVITNRFSMFTTYLKAASDYDPGRLVGDVLLITARSEHESGRTWLPMLSGKIVHERLPGNHFSIVHGEHARRIAMLIDELT